MADFQKDLSRGQRGEALFHKFYPELTRLDGRGADFICPSTGNTYEVKTDFYTSPNFFIERWSDTERQKKGGPWQSAEKGVSHYAFLFPNLGLLYIFLTSDLIGQIESVKEKRTVRVQNRTWITEGLVVNRELLKAQVEVLFEPIKF